MNKVKSLISFSLKFCFLLLVGLSLERIISASGICIQTVWIEAFVIGAMIVIVGNHVLKML